MIMVSSAGQLIMARAVGGGARGDRLLRPMGSWTPAVYEYLRHLEAAGFDGSPRVLGIEGDREVLTFIDGDVANDPQWQPGHGHRLPPYARTKMALRGAAELIRRLHRAVQHRQPDRQRHVAQFHAPGHVASMVLTG
jgi:hypothetical protein